MKRASDGKIDNNHTIFSNDLITEKEGYKAMYYMLEAYFEATRSDDLTDILGAGRWDDSDRVLDTAYWEYWLEAIEKVKKEAPST